MKITFLGTNGWYGTSAGNTICTLVESEKYYIVFDAGDGLYKIDEHITSPKKPIFLFLSHFHLDHIFGFHILPKFKFKNKFHIYCAKGAKKYLMRCINHPFSNPFKDISLNIVVKEISDKEKLPFSIECKKLFHIDPSFGYRLTLDGKIITYCSDTGTCKNAIYLSRDSDVLIHECSNRSGMTSGKWGHVNPEEAAQVAKDAGAKKLFLTHFSAAEYPEIKGRIQAQKAARKIFKNTVASRDNMTVTV